MLVSDTWNYHLLMQMSADLSGDQSHLLEAVASTGYFVVQHAILECKSMEATYFSHILVHVCVSAVLVLVKRRTATFRPNNMVLANVSG